MIFTKEDMIDFSNHCVKGSMYLEFSFDIEKEFNTWLKSKGERKKIIHIDMDGVVADFENGFKKLSDVYLGDGPDYGIRSKIVDETCLKHPTFFQDLEPIEGSIESVKKLMDVYEVHFLSSPMWAVPHSYTGKREWIYKHFGESSKKRLILSHRKDLSIGDYLIDDRIKNGVDKFKGEHIHFGTDKFPNWQSVLDYLIK